MAVRNIRVIGDRMEPRRIYAGTRGSYITEVAFTFSGEWDGLTKKLIFYPVRGKPVYINYTYGSEKIPYEVMRYSGDAIMLMSGYSVEPDGSLGDKIVTASAFVAVDPAESDTQNEPDIPEATEFEKIVAKLGAPYIGENGNWFVWDVYTHEFVDTGLPARGEQGETGRGLTILGKYGSLDDLRASVKDAQPGDAYAVGEKAPYTIYIWDDVSGDFTNHGDLRGVGITKIEQITDNTGSGEPNTIRIVTDDGAEYDYTVYNGERGHPGNIWIGETEPPDDSYTIWMNPGGAVSGFLESHQGTENAGRVLVVDDDGIVRPGEYAGGGGGTITQESDPTVPAWAKQPQKPTYTAKEVGALSESELDSAIDSALAEAKESGEFDGGRGAMILNVTSWPLVYTTETNSLIKYRSPISNVLAQSGASDVKAGDIVWCGTYHYSVLSTDDTYAYMGAYTFIQGAPGKSAYSYAQDGGYTGTEEDFAKKLAQDVPEGGGSGGSGGGEWTKLGDITVSDTFEFNPISFTGGVVTLDTNADGYSFMSRNRNVVFHPIDITYNINPTLYQLRPKDYAAGTFDVYNLDGQAQTSASMDITKYKMSVSNIGLVEMNDIPYYDRYKVRFTFPTMGTHGIRKVFRGNVGSLCFDACFDFGRSGGVIMEHELFTFPYDPNYMVRRSTIVFGNFYGMGAGATFEAVTIVQSGEGKTHPVNGVVNFQSGTCPFVNGSRFELWGANDV